MIKAFFVDFYGTIVHEDGEVIKEITKIICDTGKVEDPSEVDGFWWKDFQSMFMNSHGETFETQRALEEKSLVHTLEKFSSSANAKELSEKMFAHWVKPPIFDDSHEFFDKSPIPIYIVSNIDTADILQAIAYTTGWRFYFRRCKELQASKGVVRTGTARNWIKAGGSDPYWRFHE